MIEASSSKEQLGGSRERLDTTLVVENRRQGRRIKPIWLVAIVTLVVLIIAGAVVGALVAKHIINPGSKSVADESSGSSPETLPGASSASSSGASSEPSSGASSAPSSGASSATSPGASPTGNSKPTSPPHPVVCPAASSIPSSAKNTWFDTTSWLDLTDFNCTFTEQTVGGLPIVGLNSTWDDSKKANANVPQLNQPWGSYAQKPFRGVSLGGWLSLEPFITPSLFDSGTELIDEYSLCEKLGPKDAATTLERHYSTFITEDDFKSIAAAGLDHVRIPYSYWAIKVYDNDPYVLGVSWRYLLRGIEWARRYGLRVVLDLHGVPGSQNGWNHSGKQGTVDWITGPDGAVNAQRTLDLHTQLSQFFAQDRYKNIVAFYGLVNEPASAIPQDQLIAWTEKAYKIVIDNGVTATQVFSESNRGLAAWSGTFPGDGNTLAIDVHLYSVFDDSQIGYTHVERINYVCDSLEAQINVGMTGFGPTMVGEWSQADTDCAEYLNGVGNGARWTGTFSGESSALCPTLDSKCSCSTANADVSTFSSDYKLFLQTFAEAQMSAFEKSWGWFYWTWKTESAPLWSYQAGLQGGILPALAYQRDWDCTKTMPSFGSLPEYY